MTEPAEPDSGTLLKTHARSGTEESLAAALAPFGWTCTDHFWQRYYSDPWVFNLANAVERLTAQLADQKR